MAKLRQPLPHYCVNVFKIEGGTCVTSIFPAVHFIVLMEELSINLTLHWV